MQDILNSQGNGALYPMFDILLMCATILYRTQAWTQTKGRPKAKPLDYP